MNIAKKYFDDIITFHTIFILLKQDNENSFLLNREVYVNSLNELLPGNSKFSDIDINLER